jgi:hypothetical protein
MVWAGMEWSRGGTGAAVKGAPGILFFERPPWNRRWLPWVLGAIFAALDFVTGPYIRFPIFFVLPVLFLAWNWGMGQGGALAMALGLVRLSFYFWWEAPGAVRFEAINGAIYCGVLLVLAAIAARVGGQARKLRERVQVLEGFLPICSFCKDIRDDKGQWQKMEAYVSQRSGARFSHGVCPVCMKKHYAELFEEGDEG